MGPIGPIGFWARPGHSVAGVVASLALSVLCWPLLTGAAQGPGPDGIHHVDTLRPAPTKVAMLTRQGNDVIITGSVAALFESGSFSGPNRAEKTNRARLTPDGVTISAGFDEARARLAALRQPAAPGQTGSTVVAMGTVPSLPSLGTTAGDNPDGTPIQVASTNASWGNALSAIEGFAPSLQAPIPMTATPALAYARETTPPTALDLTFDRFGGKVTTADIHCMAEAIYFEARGESYKGQVAVGQVVMNRLAHPIYPKDICQVVFQNQQMRDACQFSFACDGRPETIDDPKSRRQADEIARGVISGSLYLPEVGKATHYHATYVYPDWAPRLKRVTKIGHHIFYQFKSA
jgi:hypothetical protein